MTSAPFVGRITELKLLDEALATARGGAGRIALLIGPPGIGKSGLAEVFMQRARRAGAEVLAGRCFEGPGAPAFWPWTQLLRAYAQTRDGGALAAELGPFAAAIAAAIPELQEHVARDGTTDTSPEEARFRFFDGITQTFLRAARARPLVLVLEDLHGADPSSLMLLRFVARELRRSRLLIVATLRDVALAPGHELTATLGELVREQVGLHVALAGLDVDEVAALMHEVAGAAPSVERARDVHRRTEGNPLYVNEVIRQPVRAAGTAGGDTDGTAVPATVRSAIAAHLAHVPAATLETLTRAALLGREFAIGVVARAVGRPVAEVLAHVDEAIAAGIVTPHPEPGRYRFAHVLFAETLVDALAETQRVALHREAAVALAADGPHDPLVPEIAHHWFAAGPGGSREEATRWTTQAALRAERVLAHEEAASWYRRALATLDWEPHDDPRTRAELLLGLGDADKRAGAAEDAKRSFELAAELGRRLSSADVLTRAALGFAPAVAWAQQAAPEAPVVLLLEEAIAAWQGADASLHARALARLAVALFYGDAARRSTSVDAALAMARRLNDDATLRYALMCGLMADPGGADVERRLALATELVHLATGSHDREALAAGRLWRCTHLLELGDVAAFDVEHAALVSLAQEIRQPEWRWYGALLVGFRRLLAGRFAEAGRAVEDAYAIGQPSLPFAAYAYHLNQLAILRRLQGRTALVEEYRALVMMFPDRAFRAVIASFEWERGRPDEARAILAELMSDTQLTARRDVIWAIASVFLAEVCDALGAAADAAVIEPALAPYADYWIPFAEGAPLGPATHALGLLARAQGRLDEAIARFERAAAECRRIDAAPFLARALAELAVSQQRRGRPGDAAAAATALGEATRLAERLGMAPLGRRPAPIAPDGAAPSPAAASVFRREAEFWVVVYEGATIRLRDARGLHYLATLLYNPGREIHVTELAGAEDVRATTVSPRDDALAVRRGLDEGTAPGPDARALERYRRRLAELEDETADAEARHDLGRLDQVRAERHALETELVAAARGRRGGTHAERARITVTKGIRTALDRITAAHPALGAHLRATVKRGYFCAYVPDPRRPITWER